MRLAPVSEQVNPGEPAIGVRDISRMTKSEALVAMAHTTDIGKLTTRERLAIELIDRMVADPHTVTDTFFREMKQAFSDEELIELICAGALFIWGNHFNITMRADTNAETSSPRHHTCVDAPGRGP